MHACVCVHVKILANVSSLIEQNIDRFGDGEKMGKNTVSFWRIKRPLLFAFSALLHLVRARVHKHPPPPLQPLLCIEPETRRVYISSSWNKIFFRKIIKLH